MPEQIPPWQDIWYLLPAGFLAPFIVTILLCRNRIKSHFVAHGLLIAMVTVILAPPTNYYYIVVDVSKLIGGILGGLIAIKFLHSTNQKHEREKGEVA